MLVITLSLNLIAFSQQDTNIKVKCLPISVFKQIAQDLLRGDSAIAQLKLTEIQITKLEEKIIIKDDIISTMKQKEENLGKIISSQNEKYEILEGYSKKLELNLKKEKVKNKFKTFLGTGAIAVLTFFLIIK